MQIRVTCGGTIEHTQVLDQHIKDKLHKIVQFLSHDREPQEIIVMIEGHPNHAHHEVDIRISAPRYHRMAHREGSNLFMVLDEVIDILYRDLCHDKEAHVDKKKNNSGPHRPG